jgi:hypothetical protein
VASLSDLCFPSHPQPWTLRKYVGEFELVTPLPFKCPYVAQKAQYVSHGCQGSNELATVSAPVLLDLYQGVIFSTQITLGLFLEVLALVFLWGQSASSLD